MQTLMTLVRERVDAMNALRMETGAVQQCSLRDRIFRLTDEIAQEAARVYS